MSACPSPGGSSGASSPGKTPPHDERLIRVIAERARESGIPSDRFEFQMLYGIRTELHRELASAGLRLRVLVPFGEDWYGYFIRRLVERPANLLFFARSLARR